MPTKKKDPTAPPPPKAFHSFSERFPRIAEAWAILGEAGTEGPLDPRTARLIKLAASIGARSEGATHSAVRKARAAGATPEEIYQVVALAASTVGLPNAVAAFTWVEDQLASAD
jgi:alkylhydroperoxidase/carboxymuconolactone decarboxylase family protein YurZ